MIESDFNIYLDLVSYVRILTLTILNPYYSVHVSVTEPVLPVNHDT